MRANNATSRCRRIERARRTRSSGMSLTGASSEGGPSQRDIAMLAPRVLELLGLERGQRPADPPPRAVRHDHVVDEAAIGRHERVGELLAIFLGALGDLVGIAEV